MAAHFSQTLFTKSDRMLDERTLAVPVDVVSLSPPFQKQACAFVCRHLTASVDPRTA